MLEDMGYRILAINPGSTSTKISVCEEDREVYSGTLEHPANELEKYHKVTEQFGMRKEAILAVLQENGQDIRDLSAVVGRGGMVPSVKSGAYLVNEVMVDRLRNAPVVEHASNLGALLAYEIANETGVNAYIYDSVRVDEMNDIARISGFPEIPRTSTTHALNSRAMAMKLAERYGRTYAEMNFVVAHMGGGISVSVHEKGQIVDVIADDEGTFSPERAGRVPCKALVDLCYSGKYDLRTLQKKLRGEGGLKAYLGTTDVREVIKRIDDGDDFAAQVLEAMAYQVAKGIGELATVVYGRVDAIIITGGIAYSSLITSWIEKRVSSIAPVAIMPGENEMESLAKGTLRVLRGEEEAREYVE